MRWVVIAVVAIALAVIGYFGTAHAVAALVFGWVNFLARVIPQVRVYWPSVVVGVSALVAFALGLHWFLRQFGKPSIEASDFHAVPQRWRFRWTVAAVSMIIVAFAAGISLVGIVHQIGWMANSQEPLLRETLEDARDGDVRNNLREIGLGVNMAESAMGRYPLSATLSLEGQPLHGWETQILPYADYMTSEIDKTRPWNDIANQKYFKCLIPFFINLEFRAPELEDAEGYGLNHFSANSRVFVEEDAVRSREIKDGAAKTILLGEVNASFSPWGRPANVRDPAAGVNRGPETFGGPPGRRGAYFLMADGSARFAGGDVDPEVLKALSTPADADE